MLPTGHVLNGTYRVERLLGQGGMAAVYVVTNTRLPRKFALKILNASLRSQPQQIERFRREAEILASLNHPHIVNVIDCNVYEDQYPYLVMELLNGQDLSEYLQEHGPLDKAVALPIFLQAAEALQAAHDAGIVHRDLKPANLFMCRNGPFPNYVKVLDFGIAKILNADGKHPTGAAAIMGTPAYMAPEQARGNNAQIEPRADQFALAAILYEMLTGRLAFYRAGDALYETLQRVVFEDPEPLDDPVLWPAIKRALSKAPEQRFASLREFIDATGAMELTASLRILELRTQPPTQLVPLPEAKRSQFSDFPTVVVPDLPWRRRRRELLGFGLALGLVGLGFFLGLRTPSPLPPPHAPPSPPSSLLPARAEAAPRTEPRPVTAPDPGRPDRSDGGTGTERIPDGDGAEHVTEQAASPVQKAERPRPTAPLPPAREAARAAQAEPQPARTEPAQPPVPPEEVVAELIENPVDGQVAAPARPPLLGSKTREQILACARAFFAAESKRALKEPIRIDVLRDPPRLSFIVAKTSYTAGLHGPRELDNCLEEIRGSELPAGLSQIVVRFHRKRGP